MGSLFAQKPRSRRLPRILAAVTAALLGSGALLGSTATAAHADIPDFVMSGTVTLPSGFVPDYAGAPTGPSGPAPFGVALVYEKAFGPVDLTGNSYDASIGYSSFIKGYDPRTHRVGFIIYDANTGTPRAMDPAKSYAMIYATVAEMKLLANPATSGSVKAHYVMSDGRRTTDFAKAGTFRIGQTAINVNLDPRVTGKKPTISGTAKVGRTLKAKVSGWQPSGVRLSYRWYRNGKAITHATKASYKVKRADRGKRISVKVTGKKSGYQSLSLTSSSKKVRKAR